MFHTLSNVEKSAHLQSWFIKVHLQSRCIKVCEASCKVNPKLWPIRLGVPASDSI